MNKKYFFIFVSLTALLCIVTAMIIFVWDIVFISNSIKTTGIVVEVKESRNEETGNPLFCPVVEYVDETGMKNTFSPGHWHSPARYEKGDTVSVAYQKENKGHAVICDFSSLWVLPFALFIVGVSQVVVLAIVVYAGKCAFVRYFFPDK